MQPEPLKILIIGGSGFLSGHLAQVATRQGHQVWTLTRGQRPVPGDVVSLIADRNNPQAFAGAICLADTFWDLAVDCIGFHPENILQDLAELNGRIGHFVFISTDFVYDPARRQFPQPEESQFYLKEGYGGLKRACEQVLLDNPSPDFKWTVLRPGHIFGPGSELGCLPAHGRDSELIFRLQENEPLQLVGGGYFLQQPVFVFDLVDTVLSLAGNPNTFSQIFNVAGPEIVESREYYRIIASYLNLPLHITELPVHQYLKMNPNSASFLCHRIYDLQKLQASGVTIPATPLFPGLKAHVEYKLRKIRRV